MSDFFSHKKYDFVTSIRARESNLPNSWSWRYFWRTYSICSCLHFRKFISDQIKIRTFLRDSLNSTKFFERKNHNFRNCMLSHSNACKCLLFYRISEIIIQHVSYSLYMYYEILNARFVDTSSFLGGGNDTNCTIN